MSDTYQPAPPEAGDDPERKEPVAPPPDQDPPRQKKPVSKRMQALYWIGGITAALAVGLVVYLGFRGHTAPSLEDQVSAETRAYYNQCVEDAGPCLGDYLEITTGGETYIEMIRDEADFDRLRRGGDGYLVTITHIAKNDGSDPARYSEYAQRYWHRTADTPAQTPGATEQPPVTPDTSWSTEWQTSP